MTTIRFWLSALAIAPIFGSNTASAQTPINAPGAMQPSTGTGVWHVMPMYREFGSDPTSTVESGNEFLLLNQIAYGITKEFSLQFDAPLVYTDRSQRTRQKRGSVERGYDN